MKTKTQTLPNQLNTVKQFNNIKLTNKTQKTLPWDILISYR